MKYFNNFNGHQSLLENMAQAKAILRKNGLDEEDEVFQKIIDLTKKDGYTGLITKLVFKDGVDLQEALDLYGDLKSKSIDVGKLSKLSYGDILDIVYEDIVKDDVKFAFKYEDYLVYHVEDYNAGLKICSPSWCLKTKRYWDDYMEIKRGVQFVAIQDKAYNKRRLLLTTPNTDMTGEYSNTKQPEIRYGVTIYPSGKFDYFDDDNKSSTFNTPEIVEKLASKIKTYMENNNIGFKKIDFSDNEEQYDKLATMISNEVMFGGSFDLGVYNEDKNIVDVTLNKIAKELDIDRQEIELFFQQYKDRILADSIRFTDVNGIMDILLYHFYGSDTHLLSGMRLDEREEEAHAYKYDYSFHKTFWGREYIKQSYGSVANWLGKLATKYFAVVAGLAEYTPQDVVAHFDLYGEGEVKDDEKYYGIDIDKFKEASLVKYGAIVRFKYKEFMKEIGLDEDKEEEFINYMKNTLFDDVTIEEDIAIIRFLDNG